MKKVFNKKNLKVFGLLILLISVVVMLCFVISSNKENEKLKAELSQIEKDLDDFTFTLECKDE